MSNSVKSERSSDRSAVTEPTLAELLDPAALERRLTEARQRRTEAIRAREERGASGEPAPGRARPGLAARPVILPVEGTDLGATDRARADEGLSRDAVDDRAPARMDRRPAADALFEPQSPSALPPLPRPPVDRAERPESGEAPRSAWKPVSTPPRSLLAEQAAARRASAAPDRQPLPAPPAAPTPSIHDWRPPSAPVREPEPSPARAPASAVIRDTPITADPGDRIAVPGRAAQAGNGLPVVLLSIFLIGLIGGGAAVLFAPPSFRARIAEAINPPADAPAPTSEPAPDTAPPDVETAALDAPNAIGPQDPAAPLPSDETGPTITALAPPSPAALDARPPVDPAPPPLLAPDGAPDETLLAGLPTAPRAETPANQPVEPVPAVPEIAATPVTPPAPETPAPASIASARISVNYPASAAQTANAIAATLRASGAGATTVVPVGFSVSASNVRYYHAEDRAAAEAVAAVVGATGPVETRDFTDFRPSPLPGIIEIWLSGQGAAAPARAPQANAAPAPAPTLRETQTAPRRDLEAEEVERVLLSREVERMLRLGGDSSQ